MDAEGSDMVDVFALSSGVHRLTRLVAMRIGFLSVEEVECRPERGRHELWQRLSGRCELD